MITNKARFWSIGLENSRTQRKRAAQSLEQALMRGCAQRTAEVIDEACFVSGGASVDQGRGSTRLGNRKPGSGINQHCQNCISHRITREMRPVVLLMLSLHVILDRLLCDHPEMSPLLSCTPQKGWLPASMDTDLRC